MKTLLRYLTLPILSVIVSPQETHIKKNINNISVANTVIERGDTKAKQDSLVFYANNYRAL